jgi:hypothetical protein
VAISLQSLLFAFAHLTSRWLPFSAFVVAMIFGTWRVRFRSLLPLVLAHIILNGAALIPHFASQYAIAARSYPSCQKIDLLTTNPAEKAMPGLMGFLADPDEVVSAHAAEVLVSRYRSEAEPYLRDALRSSDGRTVDRALFVVEQLGYSHCSYPGLKPQLRLLAWSHEDPRIQLGAMLALHARRDDESLGDIAKRHPDVKIRRFAAHLLDVVNE